MEVRGGSKFESEPRSTKKALDLFFKQLEAPKLQQRNATKPRVNTARGVPLVGKVTPPLYIGFFRVFTLLLLDTPCIYLCLIVEFESTWNLPESIYYSSIPFQEQKFLVPFWSLTSR